MAIETLVFVRVTHNGMRVECSDTKNPNANWRACGKCAPPSFTTGMIKDDVRKMRDLCDHILQNVYDDYA